MRHTVAHTRIGVAIALLLASTSCEPDCDNFFVCECSVKVLVDVGTDPSDGECFPAAAGDAVAAARSSCGEQLSLSDPEACACTCTPGRTNLDDTGCEEMEHACTCSVDRGEFFVTLEASESTCPSATSAESSAASQCLTQGTGSCGCRCQSGAD